MVSLLVSIGVLQTPLAEWVGLPETPAVSPVTRNRRLADACLIDMIAGMGCFDWIVGVALSMHSASSRRPWPNGLAFRRHLRCPRLLGIGVLQTPA